MSYKVVDIITENEACHFGNDIMVYPTVQLILYSDELDLFPYVSINNNPNIISMEEKALGIRWQGAQYRIDRDGIKISEHVMYSDTDLLDLLRK